MQRVVVVAVGLIGVAAAAAPGGDRLPPIDRDSPASRLAREAGVDPAAVRQVLAVGRGWGRLSLLAARRGQRLCLSSEVVHGGARFASPFRCVPRALTARPPIVAYGVHDDAEGPTLRVTVGGAVRPDVTRVVVATFGGSRRAVRLVPMPSLGLRAFGYAATRPLDRPPPRRNDLPSSISAFRGSVRVASVELGPPCCSRPPVPTLTPRDEARALALATADPTVRATVGSRPTRVVTDADGKRVGVWETYKTRAVIGAAVELEWDQPLALDRRWPSIAYDYTEVSAPPYREGLRRVRTRALTRLTVLVDLGRDKVVAVQPGPRSG
jgi:hypothetical protein